ncbi:helix-turn-helix domain-containing protein [Roseobacter sp. HKCCD9010]|uniref:helix-turn-helix domain-containing protein n=1 Tax=unclassified Roseobacter TaxID=196798 RepID=UPI0019E65D26|nr:helix-turn-helix domain-containing protein [Rhodobacterales bacterium HKCCD4356]NNV11912.1 helix-turn-helix domain-containing protein [Roseobacter sp. HKCCD7357]NNV16925.1 helix-turn-helix domain-containing protein [Roseobacter sp. HKCCD8768]NNV26154.1 helix-turn-helix domain-containing protein [Roseobacter sp. HKCCD8192]NNV30646.1 helix-turn-helix domain-containing protein [Roseobacter sp. HKCCD9061]NNV34912.1 helix-turn-helix domain-containing protein [Roseobacter sp. HKCCD9073]NNV38932.
MRYPRPYSPDDLAARWDCSAETVRQMHHRGELHAFRVGRMLRIPAEEVERVEQCQKSPSDACEAGSASLGPTLAPARDGAISLRHARERKPRPRVGSGTCGKPGQRETSR